MIYWTLQLLLLAISRLVAGEQKVPFGEVEEALTPLLEAYAPGVESRHQPELPYWHLRSDGLWSIEGAEDLPLQKGGFPKMQGLRQTTGQLDSGFAKCRIRIRLSCRPLWVHSLRAIFLIHRQKTVRPWGCLILMITT